MHNLIEVSKGVLLVADLDTEECWKICYESNSLNPYQEFNSQSRRRSYQRRMISNYIQVYFAGNYVGTSRVVCWRLNVKGCIRKWIGFCLKTNN